MASGEESEKRDRSSARLYPGPRYTRASGVPGLRLYPGPGFARDPGYKPEPAIVYSAGLSGPGGLPERPKKERVKL